MGGLACVQELVSAARTVLRSNYGTVAITFSRAVSLKEYVAQVQEEKDSDYLVAIGTSEDDPRPGRVTAEEVTTLLQHTVTERLVEQTVCMPTHLVATTLLAYRHGLTLTELQDKFDWLYNVIKSHGGVVRGVESKVRHLFRSLVCPLACCSVARSLARSLVRSCIRSLSLIHI